MENVLQIKGMGERQPIICSIYLLPMKRNDMKIEKKGPGNDPGDP